MTQFDFFLRRMTWTGFRRGRNGSQAWLVMAVVVVGIRSLRRLARTPPQALYRTELKPGERFEVNSLQP